MNKEELEWLLDIATPTGISYSGDQTITIDFANKVINYINKQKEVLDKIKEKLHNSKEYKMATAMELNKEQSILIDIDKLLEEIE